MAEDSLPACRICGASTTPAGEKRSTFSGRVFALGHCERCRFSFVVDPRDDFETLYGDAYYRGEGADPLVAYEGEIDDPRTIRLYEWRGLEKIIRSLTDVGPRTRWLDFGSGLGGFVRYLRLRGIDAVAHDQGWAAQRLREEGVPSLAADELERAAGSFDVVTAIEVVEHTPNPIGELEAMAALLRPGGLLFLTTGNAARLRGRLRDWDYVLPDIHVSFFEPETLVRALRQVGLEPEMPGRVDGFTDLIRFKVLKNLRRRRRGALERLVPWTIASRVVDRRRGVSSHPIGRKLDV